MDLVGTVGCETTTCVCTQFALDSEKQQQRTLVEKYYQHKLYMLWCASTQMASELA